MCHLVKGSTIEENLGKERVEHPVCHLHSRRTEIWYLVKGRSPTLCHLVKETTFEENLKGRAPRVFHLVNGSTFRGESRLHYYCDGWWPVLISVQCCECEEIQPSVWLMLVEGFIQDFSKRGENHLMPFTY